MGTHCYCALSLLLGLGAGCSSSVGGSGNDDAGVSDAAGDAQREVADARPLEDWILTLDNSDDNTGHQLVQVSIADEDFGTVTTICADVTLPNTVPSTNIISSLTFNNGLLYASGKGADEGDTLFLVDPCECTATVVGQYGYTFVAGITSTGAQDMFGISGEQDVVFGIDPSTALGSLLSVLAEDWSTVGLTWSGTTRDSLWGISGATDQLYEFSVDGTQLGTVDMDFNFSSVGVEYHPGVDTIYACSGSGEILVVNPTSGAVTVGPNLGLGTCNNLAAPFGSVNCIN